MEKPRQERENPMPELIVTVEKVIGAGFGSISAPEMTQEQAEDEASKVNEFLRGINLQNPAVCIDGRKLADGETALELGAHFAGGAETALVAAQSLGLTIKGKELVDNLKSQGFVLGGHDADTNKAKNYEGGTGCGACDKCEAGCNIFNDNKEAAKPTVALLMGDDFNDDAYNKVNLIPVNEPLSSAVDKDLIETLQDDGQGVHGHREQMVIFNYAENTTIDRDAYFNETGKQVFVVDMWYLKKLAGAMAQVSENEASESELYHAMVDFQVATYLSLCDGSHRSVLIQEAPVAA